VPVTADQGAWTEPPLDPARREALRAALGVGPIAPVVEDAGVAWEPARWLAALGDGEVAGLLESSAGPDDVARWSIFASAPRFVLTARPDGTTDVDGTVLDAHLLDVLDALCDPGGPEPAGVPFVGGLIGYLSYDAGRWFEDLPDTVAHDVATPAGRLRLLRRRPRPRRARRAHPPRPHPSGGRRRAVAGRPCHPPAGRGPHHGRPRRRRVERHPRRVPRHGAPGPGVRVRRRRVRGLPVPAASRCRSRARPPASTPPSGSGRRRRFAAYCGFADHALVSSSPERFLAHDGARLETRPIKGTSRRHDDPTANAEVVAAMQDDRKQLAEHLMIVDLSRSDLSRVCAPGTVVVPHLARAETYSHVNHLVSVIEGRPTGPVGLRRALAATFPGGSITGAPKVRAMEVIDELEPVARGAYTGSVGYVSVDGRFDLNMAIRTVVVSEGRLHGQVGGAIVADSDPAAEWQETEDKAQGMLVALATLAGGTVA
jgi:para-aminobenzoate synthetase component 1